jgi:similar to stage IV sporulation protein
VKEGDVVKKGEILVSGVINIMSDFDEVISKEPIIADADIRCKSFYEYKNVFTLDYTKKLYTGKEKNRFYFNLFRKKLFLYSPRNSYLMYDIIVNEKKLHITESFYLPLSYGKITTREYNEEKSKFTNEEAFAIAEARLNRYLEDLVEKDALITANNVKITIKDNRCIAKGRIMVEEPAWEYKVIQENEWRIEPTDEHNGDNH